MSFAWDPDYDGSAFAPDAALTGRRPTHTYPDDIRTRVALQVGDADGAASEIATAEVRIANADPTVEAGGDARMPWASASRGRAPSPTRAPTRGRRPSTTARAAAANR